MRQRITVDQLQQLTPSQQEKLREWWKPNQWDLLLHRESVLCVNYADNDLIKCANYYPVEKESTLPLLSIGQCIELLQAIDGLLNIVRKSGILHDDLNSLGWEVELRHHETWKISDELIDALFEAVKSIL